MNKWERRDAQRANIRKMRVVGTSMMQRQRIVMAKAQAVADRNSSITA